MRGHGHRALLLVGVALVGAAACGAASTPIRVSTAAHTPAGQFGHCGVTVGYVPPGLKLLNVGGGPERSNVDLRYTSPHDPVDKRWAYVGAAWGPVMPLEKLHRVYYPTSTSTTVQGQPAILVRLPPDSVLVQWNQSSSLTVSVEGRGGLTARDVQRIADHVSVPSTRPSNLPGPPEAPPEGCAERG